MSKSFKIGIAICLLGALVMSGFLTGYASEFFKDYKTSRIFLAIFLVGVPCIWIILFKIEKNKLEKDELE